jgi:carbamoyl-phosphate synthase large subunit
MKVVLTTGVGALIGQGILRSLKDYDRHPITILGMDLSSCTHAKYLCHDFIQKPAIDESKPEYLRFWTSMVEQYEIDLILPGIENDLVFLATANAASAALPALINSDQALQLGLDKYELYIFSLHNQVKTIPTVLASDHVGIANLLEHCSSYILKPRRSNGSRGIHRLQSRNELAIFLENSQELDLSQYILQPIIGDASEEYTASIFGYGDGSYNGPIVFCRLLSKSGYTKYAKTVEASLDILASIETISRLVCPVGPTNFQYRYQNGEYLLMEINPRFSSTTSLKAAFGFDETTMALDFFFDKVKNNPAKLVKGEAFRFTADYIRYL